MPRKLLSRSLLGGLVLTALLLTGCGGIKTVPVKGKLVLPQGLTVGQNDTVQIVFVLDEAPSSGKAAPQPVAEYNPSDSTFTASLPKKSGIPPGKYKVTVQISGYPNQQENPKRKEYIETLNEKFSPKNTTLSCEVAPEGAQSFTIDLGQGTVSKG